MDKAWWKRGLWRKSTALLAGFGLVTAVTVALVGTLAERRIARQRFLDLARANAAFVESSGLPASLSLARKLSEVLGMSVAFRLGDGTVVVGSGNREQWAGPLRRLEGNPPDGEVLGLPGKLEWCSVPLGRSGSGQRMIFLRMMPEVPAAFPAGLAGLVVLVPLLALLPALFLAREVVGPLERLGEWLPTLRLDDAAAEPPRLPAALLERQDEIGDLARTLVETRDRLANEVRGRRESERMALFGRMATSLAHEIKNPTAAISLHADLLEGELDAADRAASLGAIRASADRISILVHQWLFVVRPDAPCREPVDLAEIVAAARTGVADLARHHGTGFELMPPPSAAAHLVRVDRVRLEHAIRNVLINACQAMPDGGTIRIEWGVNPGEKTIWLTVSDEGTGFAPEVLAAPGTPFLSTKEGGMGLGLHLVREVVAGHGGTVAARNLGTGSGAEVTIRLPGGES